jgi:flagellar motility protein MotE (MotC chaperone)
VGEPVEVEGVEYTPSKKKPNILLFIGAFVLSYLIVSTFVFFILKNKYQKLSETQTAAVETTKVDTGKLKPETGGGPLTDTTALAKVDTSAPAPAETTAIAQAETSTIAKAESLLAAYEQVTKMDTGIKPVDTTLVASRAKATVPPDSATLAEQRRRVDRLVRIVDKMSPNQVADIFSKLDDDFVVQMLLRMNERNAAKVLTVMPASRAARLSQKIGEIATQ